MLDEARYAGKLARIAILPMGFCYYKLCLDMDPSSSSFDGQQGHVVMS